MLSRELTNPVFTDIAFGASHTYCHWHRISAPTPPQRGEGLEVRGPHLKTLPMLQGEELFFNIIFLRDQPRKLQKTDGSGVLALGSQDFPATPLLIASFDKFILYKRLGV